MNLTREVVRLVEALARPATADDIAPLVPDRTRDQVMTAMHNARTNGWLERVGQLPGGRDALGIYQSTGVLVDRPKPAPPKAKDDEDEDDERPLSHAGLPPRGRIPNVASVWELGRL